MTIRPDTDDLIGFLDSLAKLDPIFMGKIVAARMPCNDDVLNHPSVQVGTVKEFRDADHGQDLSEGIGALQDGQGIAGILGILNGYCGTYDDGPRKGWGPISVEVQKDGRVTRVFRTPNGHTVRAA